MKKIFLSAIILMISGSSFAQKEKEDEKESKSIKVPAAVKSSLSQKYPSASRITWEKEKGNYEANWGGKEGEDNSVLLTPKGDFIEIVNVIPQSALPSAAAAYLKSHYKGIKSVETAKVTDAHGKISYEAEFNKKTIIFDENGNFVKAE